MDKIDKNFHKKYLQWKTDSKNGKKSYYISNIVVSSLISTAIFSVVLGLINLILKLNLDAYKVIAFALVFMLVYGAVTFIIYSYLWNSSSKKYASYEKALNQKLLEKIQRGEIEDKDGIYEKLKAQQQSCDTNN